MNNQIKRAVNGLLFIGGRSDSCDKSGDETGCESEVARVARRLREHGRELASLLALDIFYDPNETTEDTLKCELAAVLPVDARPCLTIIPVMPDSLDKTNGIAMQAISAADPVREQAATDQRFPMSAYAGPI